MCPAQTRLKHPRRFLIFRLVFDRLLLACALLLTLIQLLPSTASAAAVRHKEGAEHGFLVVRNQDGKTIAAGDLVQVVHGSRVTARLAFRFRDGSVDDDTAVFTQQGTFHLLSDHHIQRGATFPHPVDTYVDAFTGTVTVRLTDKDGGQKVTTDHVEMPPDLANGMALVIVKNIQATDPDIKLPMLVATPKPRLIKLAITSRGEEPCLIGGVHRQALHYVGKVDLGGVTGAVAPLIGKQPEDVHMWVLGGLVPAVLKIQSQFYQDGPVWIIEPATPVWPQAAQEGNRKPARN